MKKKLVVDVLHDEELGIFPDIEIQGLVDKFLVKYTIEYIGLKVTMNQLIKKMGHEVVRQKNHEEPGQRTRLMGHRDVVRVLRDCSGTYYVRSIRLEDSDETEGEETVQFEALRNMSGLRFIRLVNCKLKWSSSSNDDMSCLSFKHLKYLEWEEFPCKSLDNIDMGNVVVIKLWNSRLEKLWEGANKCLKKLKILDVSGSSSLYKTGNFIGLENLEKLSLSGCENLRELDSSMGCLRKLVLLNLSDCKLLKRISRKMIVKLTSLQKLYLNSCPNTLKISNKVGSLKSVRYFLSSKNKFDSHSNSLCQLHQLTRIILSGCINLKSIPNLPPNMEYLYAQGCENLENLPSNISELQNLIQLWLNDCLKLGSEGFTQVTQLRNLQELHMRNCNISQVSCEIGNLVSLRLLDLSGNTFSSLPETFSNLLKLERLFISECSQLQSLPTLPSQLTYIDTKYCGSLDAMPFDSRQKTYTFPSKAFKESLMSDDRLDIRLLGKEVPEWCTYRNNIGNVLSFVAPIQFDQTKICGLILSAAIV